MTLYYSDKIEILKDIFEDPDLSLEAAGIKTKDTIYPIIDDVIILSSPEVYTPHVNELLGAQTQSEIKDRAVFSEKIQYSFGREWEEYSEVLEEHKKEFDMYFDIVDIDTLAGKRVCDLGCGNGRWSYFLKDKVETLILVDFSDAVFVARDNLRKSSNALFFMCDIRSLPFKRDCADFIFCLGVLHHLPTDCLEETINISKYAKEMLVFLYYALDNRPFYYRIILKAVTCSRILLSMIKSVAFRKTCSILGTYFIYKPLILLGKFLDFFGQGSKIPLYDFYKDKSAKRIQQDVYDRFFTSIEQRVSRSQILSLYDRAQFSDIKISENLPYWHFLVKR